MSSNRRIKPFSGFSRKTVDHLVLDAGAFFKNYDMSTDTYASAKAAGKCIGATNGGGEFNVTPTYRNGEFDGVRARTKGNLFIDTIEVYLKATLAEITEDVMKMALGSADSDTANENSDYDKIVGRTYVLDNDYMENITWIGTLLGEDKPIAIQIYNAYAENGLSMSVADKGQASIELQFYGYQDEDAYDIADDGDDVTPPYAIFYPKETTQAAAPSNGSTSGGASGGTSGGN